MNFYCIFSARVSGRWPPPRFEGCAVEAGVCPRHGRSQLSPNLNGPQRATLIRAAGCFAGRAGGTLQVSSLAEGLMNRDKWCVEFVNELIVNAQPPVQIKVARAIAQTEHLTHPEVDPHTAARDWLETRHPAPRSTAMGTVLHAASPK